MVYFSWLQPSWTTAAKVSRAQSRTRRCCRLLLASVSIYMYIYIYVGTTQNRLLRSRCLAIHTCSHFNMPWGSKNLQSMDYLEVSWNGGTTKSSTLMGFSTINHQAIGVPGVPPFLETPICMWVCTESRVCCSLRYRWPWAKPRASFSNFGSSAAAAAWKFLSHSPRIIRLMDGIGGFRFLTKRSPPPDHPF